MGGFADILHGFTSIGGFTDILHGFTEKAALRITHGDNHKLRNIYLMQYLMRILHSKPW